MDSTGPRGSGPAAFESFLVEDMILTLGNLRGSLGWLGAEAAADRACLDRLDRQLGLLEDRARRMARRLREPAPPEPANLFAMSEPAPDGGTDGPARGRSGGGAAVFRSRRG